MSFRCNQLKSSDGMVQGELSICENGNTNVNKTDDLGFDASRVVFQQLMKTVLRGIFCL